MKLFEKIYDQFLAAVLAISVVGLLLLGAFHGGRWYDHHQNIIIEKGF